MENRPQPYLADGRLQPRLTDRVAAELSASVFGFAVGALVQTSGVDRNDLNQRVFPDLGQQQRSTTQLLSGILLLAV